MVTESKPSGLMSKVRRRFARMLSSGIFRTTTKAQFLTYDDITLKLYLEIAGSGEYKKLAIKGKPDIKLCTQAWEEIVKRNNAASETADYGIFLDSYKALLTLLSDYNVIKGSLTVLLFQIDQ